ncbi:MAG: hypothetical protein IKJ39_10885 [Lachnospiraceae bacterium]|nr:hypothetical protein [Lachnospiraceae bacterium]
MKKVTMIKYMLLFVCIFLLVGCSNKKPREEQRKEENQSISEYKEQAYKQLLMESEGQETSQTKETFNVELNHSRVVAGNSYWIFPEGYTLNPEGWIDRGGKGDAFITPQWMDWNIKCTEMEIESGYIPRTVIGTNRSGNNIKEWTETGDEWIVPQEYYLYHRLIGDEWKYYWVPYVNDYYTYEIDDAVNLPYFTEKLGSVTETIDGKNIVHKSVVLGTDMETGQTFLYPNRIIVHGLMSREPYIIENYGEGYYDKELYVKEYVCFEMEKDEYLGNENGYAGVARKFQAKYPNLLNKDDCEADIAEGFGITKDYVDKRRQALVDTGRDAWAVDTLMSFARTGWHWSTGIQPTYLFPSKKLPVLSWPEWAMSRSFRDATQLGTLFVNKKDASGEYQNILCANRAEFNAFCGDDYVEEYWYSSLTSIMTQREACEILLVYDDLGINISMCYSEKVGETFKAKAQFINQYCSMEEAGAQVGETVPSDLVEMWYKNW